MKPILSPIINRLVDSIPDNVRARIPEGSASRELLRFLSNTLQQKTAIANVAETGFNTGGSSRAFLAARPDVNVVSFDIGKHVLVRRKKAQLDKSYPGRHELVLGDSTATLPEFARIHPDRRFDLVFIDGGHDYEVAMADIVNFRRMAHADTIVIMDDMTPWWEWGEGPTKAWRDAIEAGVIVGSQLYKNGQQVKELTGRGLDSLWAVGFYHFEQS